MKEDMFYKAHPFIFKRAEELRNNPTYPESLVWNYVKDNQFGIKFRRQHPASNYVLDFYAHTIKLAIEIDGDIHSLEDVKRNDLERRRQLESLGIQILRFSVQEVERELDKVVEKIKLKIKELSTKQASQSSPVGAAGLQVIPAIDIIDGKCVRLEQGNYDKVTLYHKEPLEVAKKFENAGLKRLHLVDLDGAKAGAVKNWKVLEVIAGKTSLVIDFGGGVKTEKDVEIVFDSGSSLATIGSIAVKDEEEFVKWLLKFGAEKFLLGADVKNEKITISGWQEETKIWIYDFIQKYIVHGVKQVFCTDVSKDGKLEGPAIDLYKNIISKFPELFFIASGGVSSVDDLKRLEETGCKGAIVGKAIYENRITLQQLKEFYRSAT
jgi:phosphoribosylformimino-5-aminoimidazole carboxamide ribotide isomerase